MKKIYTPILAMSRSLALVLTSTLLVVACTSEPDEEPTVDPDVDDTTVETPSQDEDLFAESFAGENDEIKFSEKFAEITFSNTIYIDAEAGDDSADGSTQESAIKTIARLSEIGIAAGDQVLLKGGDTVYSGMISLSDIDNSAAGSYIHIGSYGDQKAKISIDGYEAAIYASNVSNLIISDLKIVGGDADAVGSFTQRCGIYVEANNANEIEGIAIDNVDIRNIYFYTSYANDVPDSRPCAEWDTANETNYGWGIRARAYGYGSITGFDIDGCNVNGVSHTGIKINGTRNGEVEVTGKIFDLSVTNCNLATTGGPGSQYSQVYGGYMGDCSTVNPGSRSDRRMWGRGSGMWLDHCEGFLFEKSLFEGSQGIADCCGAHIDIYNKNITIQHCLSRNNAGGFVEVLGKSYNCTYRYNVSINDGWRNKNDVMQYPLWLVTDPTNPIMNNGCLVTVNGLDPADDQYEGPYNTYIYNNTIVCAKKTDEGYTNPLIFELATSASGVLVMNNIFWIEEQMSTSWSNHSYDGSKFINNAYDFRVADELNSSGSVIVRDMTESEIADLNFTIKNNLYRLYDASMPNGESALPAAASGSENSYKDENALGGDPLFANADGTDAESVIPSASDIINQGMDISMLSGDAVGVYGGMSVESDMFGNVITTPIVGACVAK